jgi:hypothetical protein
MKQILKYEVKITDRFTITMPSGSEVLCVQVQRNIPQIWVMVDLNNTPAERQFALRGTGEPFDYLSNVERYIGTFQLSGFVWHLFDIGENTK